MIRQQLSTYISYILCTPVIFFLAQVDRCVKKLKIAAFVNKNLAMSNNMVSASEHVLPMEDRKPLKRVELAGCGSIHL